MENGLYDGHSCAFAYCWAVLGYDKSVLMNWGISPCSIKEIPGGTSFHVDSLMHTGLVEVTIDYSTDTFTVVLKTDACETLASHTANSLRELVPLIDRLVKNPENYDKQAYKQILAM